MTLNKIKILRILYGAAELPRYVEFFDTINKRTRLQSTKTFQKNFNLSDDELEQIIKDSK